MTLHDSNELVVVDLPEVVGDADVVLLGEATHGDGAGMVAMVKIVQRLHAEMGFGCIAFESPAWCAERAWSASVAGTAEPVAIARDGIYGIWSNAREMLPLWQHIADHATGPTPLRLSGIDCKILRSGLASLLGALGESTVGTDQAWEAHWRRDGTNPEAMLERWATAATGDDFLAEIVDGLRTFDNFLADNGASSARDIWMGERVVRIVAEVGVPTIVWGASFHTCSTSSMQGESGDGVLLADRTSTGDVVRGQLGQRVRTVALVAGSGRAGQAGPRPRWELDPPNPGSFENACKAVNTTQLIRPPEGIYEAGPLGYQPTLARWSEIVDAFLYVPEMHPATPLLG